MVVCTRRPLQGVRRASGRGGHSGKPIVGSLASLGKGGHEGWLGGRALADLRPLLRCPACGLPCPVSPWERVPDTPSALAGARLPVGPSKKPVPRPVGGSEGAVLGLNLGDADPLEGLDSAVKALWSQTLSGPACPSGQSNNVTVFNLKLCFCC